MEKKIPRAIKQSILDQLKKIDKDVNKAIESLLHANSRELKPEKADDTRELALKIWKYIEPDVQNIVDKAIEETKRGYR